MIKGGLGGAVLRLLADGRPWYYRRLDGVKGLWEKGLGCGKDAMERGSECWRGDCDRESCGGLRRCMSEKNLGCEGGHDMDGLGMWKGCEGGGKYGNGWRRRQVIESFRKCGALARKGMGKSQSIQGPF